MITTAQITYAEITTECICETYNESNGNSVPSDSCYGCWEESLSDLRDNLLIPFFSVIGADDNSNILVEGTGLGWQGRSGWIVVTANNLHSALAINGEYQVKYRFDGTELKARRWSHDEPTGTGVFTFALAPDDAE